MIETYADQVAILQALGQPLIFAGNSYYGILEVITEVMDMQGSFTSVETVVYNCLMLTKDCITLNLSVGNTFTGKDTAMLYTYQVATLPTPDHTGFSNMKVYVVVQAVL